MLSTNFEYVFFEKNTIIHYLMESYCTCGWVGTSRRGTDTEIDHHKSKPSLDDTGNSKPAWATEYILSQTTTMKMNPVL